MRRALSLHALLTVYTVNTRLLSGLHIRNRIFAQIRNFLAIQTRNFPNRIQFLTFSCRSYANFCLLMCAKVRIYCKYMPSVMGLHIRNRIFAQIRIFCRMRIRIFPNLIQYLTFSRRSYASFCLLMCAKERILWIHAFCQASTFGTGFSLRSGICLPSGSGIFQSGSSSFPFPVAPMPISVYSCVPRCVNTRIQSGFHIWNQIFAQIRNFFAIRIRNFPNRVVLSSHNSPCKKLYNKGPPPSAWASLLNKPFSHFEKNGAFYLQF